MSSGELVSRRLRTRLLDALSDFYVVREIRQEFEDAGFRPWDGPPKVQRNGERRSLGQSYLDNIDFADPAQVRGFLQVLASVMRTIRRREASLHAQQGTVDALAEELRRCGWEWTGGEIHALSSAPGLVDAKALADRLDLPHLREHIARIERAVDTDPALAIGAAKEMLETVLKTIIGARGDAPGADEDIPRLAKKAFKLLRQLPDDVPEAARGADLIRRMLQQLAAAPQTLGELRGLYGTGHGRDGKARGLRARHARLAVGAAATVATYLLETHLEDRA